MWLTVLPFAFIMEEGRVPKRRRGGQRQRLAAAQADEYPMEMGDSALANFLLSMFAWGVFSPQRCQQIAKLAISDIEKAQDQGGTFSDLQQLASLGCAGQYPNKCHGELMNYCQAFSQLPNVFYADVPFKDPWNFQEQGFLLPHELFAAIYNHYPDTWEKTIVPDTHTLHEFWNSVDSHPQMLNHPIKTRPNWKDYAVPIGLHGDGVPITGVGKVWCKLMTIFSWSSLVGKGSTLDMCYYIWGVFDRLALNVAGHGTYDTFFKILQWSLYWLWQGVWPDAPWDSDEKHLGVSLCMVCDCLIWFLIGFFLSCFYFDVACRLCLVASSVVQV